MQAAKSLARARNSHRTRKRRNRGAVISIVAIGDVGTVDGMIHLGDEAMFEEFVVQMRGRGVTDVVALSSHPLDTASRYGVEAIAQLGFVPSQDRAALESRSAAILRTARGEPGLLDEHDSAHAVVSAVRSSVGVAITGGGNLASNWPMHIAERATLGALARLFGVPLVVTGQTLGPNLDAPDRTLVGDLLAGATLASVREPSSLALARDLGLQSVVHHVDDASFLGWAQDNARTPDDGQQYCLVTLSSHLAGVDRKEFFDAVAPVLDRISENLGLRVVFLPHFGSLDPDGPPRGDAVMHAAVAERMSESSDQRAPTTARAAAALARGADLVVTSRYHPAVFAVPAGVPTLGISVDPYTAVKLTGALGSFARHPVIPLTAVMAGRTDEAIDVLWSERHRLRRSTDAVIGQLRASTADWWDRVAGVFGGQPGASEQRTGNLGAEAAPQLRIDRAIPAACS